MVLGEQSVSAPACWRRQEFPGRGADRASQWRNWIVSAWEIQPHAAIGGDEVTDWQNMTLTVIVPSGVGFVAITGGLFASRWTTALAGIDALMARRSEVDRNLSIAKATLRDTENVVAAEQLHRALQDPQLVRWALGQAWKVDRELCDTIVAVLQSDQRTEVSVFVDTMRTATEYLAARVPNDTPASSWADFCRRHNPPVNSFEVLWETTYNALAAQRAAETGASEERRSLTRPPLDMPPSEAKQRLATVRWEVELAERTTLALGVEAIPMAFRPSHLIIALIMLSIVTTFSVALPLLWIAFGNRITSTLACMGIGGLVAGLFGLLVAFAVVGGQLAYRKEGQHGNR